MAEAGAATILPDAELTPAAAARGGRRAARRPASGWRRWPRPRAAWRARTPPQVAAREVLAAAASARVATPPRQSRLTCPARGVRSANTIRQCRITVPILEEGKRDGDVLARPSARFAETLGTALLVLVGPGSVVATLVLAGDSTPAITGADLLGISFAFGLIITALVYALGKVSGCHINPAVTFALAATKRFPWREVPTYWAAQVVGAVLGALGIWARLRHDGDRPRDGADLVQRGHHDLGSAIFAEGIGTFMLMFAILGIVDSRSPGDFAGLVIGGVVIAIIMVVGPMTGASLNPARAFGPELVSAIGGGATHWDQLIPVYILPGLVGAGLAAFAYDFLAEPRDRRAADQGSRHATPTPARADAPRPK